MYAVIRAGGKQYRVAPGDVIKIEKVSQAGGEKVQFDDVLAFSAAEGELGKPSKAFVTGQVVEHGRGDKVLVFHYKRKKQYKKLRGHRQSYTAVRISEIAFGGQSFKAPELKKKEPKVKKAAPAEEPESHPQLNSTEERSTKGHAKKKAVPKKAAKKSAAKKQK